MLKFHYKVCYSKTQSKNSFKIINLLNYNKLNRFISMQFRSAKIKQYQQILDTRPSRNWTNRSQDQLQEHSQTENSSSKKTSKRTQNTRNDHNDYNKDKTIKFQNGWIYEGQHFNQKFHGWGQLVSKSGKLIYRGNFSNGYFHNQGQLYFDQIFSYFICIDSIKQWIIQYLKQQNQADNNLKQIQSQSQHRNIRAYSYSFAKNKNILQNSQQKNSTFIQQTQKTQQNIEWIKYTGEFHESNITGFGKLKLTLVGNSQDKSLYKIKTKRLQIIGKFKNGKIINGIIKQIT